MKKQGNSREAGFTLIEMMIVLIILLILLGLLGPKLWSVVTVSKLMKTTAECAAVNIAFANYVHTHAGTINADNPVNVSSYGSQHPPSNLSAFLTPLFIKWIPTTDAWGRPYEYYYNSTGSLPDISGPHVFLIRSLGADGVPDGNSYPVGPFDPSLTSGNPGFQGDDIVCADGELVHWPAHY